MQHPPEIEGATRHHTEIETDDVGRLRVHYAEAGSGEPVLLLHGWPQHFWCWRWVVPLLADDYRLICPDLRGFGWTDAPGHGYDAETFASDALALLDRLQLERVRLVGHDWGGYAGFLLALRQPQRVEAYLALNTPVPWFAVTPRLVAESWRGWYAWVLATVGTEVLARRPSFVVRTLTRDAVHPAISQRDARAYAARLREPARARATMLLYRSYQRAFLDAGPRRRYHDRRLTAPTRLLFGTRDFYISKELTRGWEAHADDMTVEYVEDSGHFIPEEKPELVAQRARELFAGNAART